MHPTLVALNEELRSRVGGDRAGNATALALATFRRLAPDELESLDVDAAAAEVERALALFEDGNPDEPTILIEQIDDRSVVMVHIADGPFVMSTILEELHRLGLDPADRAHPAVGVSRDASGGLLEIRPARDADRREAYLSMDLQSVLAEDKRTEVTEQLSQVLADALRVVGDFSAITTQVEEIAEEVLRADPAEQPRHLAPDEVAAFLQWLLDDHLVFLGYRAYQVTDDGVEVVAGSGLGLLADDSQSAYAEPVATSALDARSTLVGAEPLLTLSRTNTHSTVHRQVRMTSINVQRLDADGTVIGEHRILGLLAQKAFVEPSSALPILRKKLRGVLDDVDVVDHSQDERALRTLFDAFPKQELFELDSAELRDSLINLVDISRRGGVRLSLRTEPNGSSVSAMVTIPRDRFSASLRAEIQDLLARRLDATSVDYQLSMTERDQPLLHFTLERNDQADPPQITVEALQQEITRLARTYADALAEALSESRDAGSAKHTAQVWSAALPAAYVENTPIDMAVIDVAELEQLDGPDAVRMRLVRPPEPDSGNGRTDLLRFRLYKAGGGVELSDFVPMLESLGLTVVEEQPYTVVGAPVADEIHIHDYGIRCETAGLHVPTDGDRVAEAALAMWHGTADVDSLNRLIIVADADVDEVTVLRAYRRYGRQVGTTYTEATINDALLEHPAVATALLRYFDSRFDPAADGEREERGTLARTAVTDALDAVSRLDQDRILRTFLGLIDATLRTNRWQDRPWLSFKLDSAAVPGVPKPVPYREIFVFSSQMEGVHLRGGRVARGGLRWSDRMDDFRTEVLGLMKAQMSKNAVIVPTGSKGGFVLKSRPDDRAALADAVLAQYRVFIQGMLDLTDNLVDGRTEHPADVVVHDGDDAYLVVAADKGTATFSDVANEISQSYGFWLDDAFASGGSQGYDHKVMGITARGAWVAVQRHFRELGVDVQEEPVDVVGVGDMSGDVFGNGMLRSRSIRLVGAFDHRDIFVDPDPDPVVSFDERKRLFELDRSSWADYDPELISEGGGVWSRTSKSIPISAQAREALGIEAEQLSPPELIRAILGASVDLLWFGGIGTYVKASDESNSDVGDRANDAVRVDADRVGARVVGEGGNLAMTQRGRIAYSRRGGRCNTDAIDNVAGVNTSDREVNLKILLREAIVGGSLDADDRDALLASMTEDIADRVLRDSYLQTWAISQDLRSAPGGMDSYERLMSRLEDQNRLDREIELLPSTVEIEQRRDADAKLTRPELSVLLAYAKIDLTDALIDADVIDQDVFSDVRDGYFPDRVSTRFRDALDSHQLRREIVATLVAGEVCNRMGITWADRVARSMGVDTPTVVAAYWIARGVIDADARWRSVEALDGRADPELQFELKQAIDWLVDAYSHSYIRQGRTNDIGAAIADDRAVFEELSAAGAQAGVKAEPRISRQAADRWMDLGITESLAEEIARLPALGLVPGIAATARQSGRSVADSGAVYALMAERLPIQILSSRLQDYHPHGRWERDQHRGLVDDLRKFQHGLARLAITEATDEQSPDGLVKDYLVRRRAIVDGAETVAREVQSQTDIDLNAMAVAVRALSRTWGDPQSASD